jgi:hypothetical protein
MREEYKQSLVKMGLNPENFEINDAEPLLVVCWRFLKWAFNPPPSKLSWHDQRYIYRHIFYYSGRLFR